MAFDKHTPNLAYSLVATAPSPATTGTSLVVTAGQGALFPTPPFNATVWASGAQPITTNAEIVRVTAISTDTLTIKRAQESTSARAVVIGDQIAATITAKTLTDVEAGFSPDLALTAMVSPRDNTIPASTSAFVASDYELGAVYGVAGTTTTGALNGNVSASPVTFSAPVVLSVVYVRAVYQTFQFSSGNMRVGIYADSAGAPAALLYTTSPAAYLSTDTLCRVPLTTAVELSGTVWLAVQTNGDINIDAGVAGPGLVQRSTGLTYAGGLPNPFGTPDITNGVSTFGIYAIAESVTEIGAGSLLEIG